MGEVIIELPLEVRRRFRITDAKVAAEVIEKLEHLEKKIDGTTQAKVTDDEVLGIWGDRKESSDEIAHRLRHGNRQHG